MNPYDIDCELMYANKDVLENNIRKFNELKKLKELPNVHMTSEQKKVNSYGYKKINELKKSLGLPSAVHAHHIDPMWRYFDVDRYVKWDPNDIVFLSPRVHYMLHSTGKFDDLLNCKDIIDMCSDEKLYLKEVNDRIDKLQADFKELKQNVNKCLKLLYKRVIEFEKEKSKEKETPCLKEDYKDSYLVVVTSKLIDYCVSNKIRFMSNEEILEYLHRYKLDDCGKITIGSLLNECGCDSIVKKINGRILSGHNFSRLIDMTLPTSMKKLEIAVDKLIQFCIDKQITYMSNNEILYKLKCAYGINNASMVVVGRMLSEKGAVAVHSGNRGYSFENLF